MRRFPAQPAPRTYAPWLVRLSLALLLCASGCPTGMRKQPKLPIKPPPLNPEPSDKNPPRLEIPDKPGAAAPKLHDPKPPLEMGVAVDKAEPTKRVTTLANTDPPVEPPPIDQPAAKKDEGIDKIVEMHKQAAAKYEGIKDYSVRFRRREFAAGKAQPEDLTELKFMKPFSVHFKFLNGSSSEGREILFVKGQNNDKMKVRLGKGDPGIVGWVIDEDPMSARATAGTRRTIYDAGLGNLVERFGGVVADQAKGGAKFGPIKYLGPQQRAESEAPMECVVQQVPAGLEPLLPKGGTRYWYFNADPKAKESGLPVLVITFDESKREVEYYCYDRLQTNLGMKVEEFDAAVAWKKR